MAIIIAKPGQLRYALQILLSAIPGLTVAEPLEADQITVTDLIERRPALVLFDFGPQTLPLLAAVKAQSSQTRCLVLADFFRQQQAAQAAGADASLRQGVAAPDILATVERLLDRPESGK